MRRSRSKRRYRAFAPAFRGRSRARSSQSDSPGHRVPDEGKTLSMSNLTRHLNRRSIALSIVAALIVSTVAAPVGQAAPPPDKGKAHTGGQVTQVPPVAPPRLDRP